MKCDEVRQLHDPCLDSELDARTTLEIQRHLAACPDCARLFAAAAKLDARIMAGLKQGQRTAALWSQMEQRVIAAAESAVRPRPSTLDPRPGLLSTLLWPHPKAWAGLAALWVVMLVVNSAVCDRSAVTEARRAIPPSPQLQEALKQQEQLVAELVGPIERPAADRPKPIAPQPRSQRRVQFMNA